jgi:ketose-bisphosphate aldolase
MLSLRNTIQLAEESGQAVGHFNVSDLVLLKAVFISARDLNTPVLVGVSEGEREFIGVQQIAVLVRSLREQFGFPIFLNADHTHSLSNAEAAANAGFDSVVFDLSALPLEQNVRETKRAVELLKGINPEILIEGEIGDIGTGSEIHEESAASPGQLTSPEEARQYVAATGVDVLAPAVGNRHGMVQSMVNGESHKHLDVGRIAQIKRATGIPLTLHGGSGTADEDLRRAITAGISIVHINTELRVAWRKGMESGLREFPHEVAPYKILPVAVDSVAKVVRARLELLNRGQ